MLGELDENIRLLIIRKIDISDLQRAEDGSMQIKRDIDKVMRSYSKKV